MPKKLIRILIALTALLGAGIPASAASIFLNESFTGATAPGWTLTGSAELTAAEGIDKRGSGWLRLTSNQTNQAGFAYDNTIFPSSYGIDINFQYSVWGGSGADGFALAIFDGSVTPDAGAYGGSLGYAQHGSIAGLAGGFLGIGFDEFGNYANPTEGRQGGPGFTPDAISIRGPGDGTANTLTPGGLPNYGFLMTTGTISNDAIQSVNWAYQRPTSSSAYRDAEVIVDTSQLSRGRLPITVLEQQGADGTKKIVASYDAYTQVLAYYGNDPAKIPATLRFGFTGSTGGSTDVHEIQNLTVSTIQDAPGFAPLVAAPDVPPGATTLLGLVLICAGGSKRRGGVAR